MTAGNTEGEPGTGQVARAVRSIIAAECAQRDDALCSVLLHATREIDACAARARYTTEWECVTYWWDAVSRWLKYRFAVAGGVLYELIEVVGCPAFSVVRGGKTCAAYEDETERAACEVYAAWGELRDSLGRLFGAMDRVARLVSAPGGQRADGERVQALRDLLAAIRETHAALSLAEHATAPLAWLRYSGYVPALTQRDVASAGRGAAPLLREAMAVALRAAETLERKYA